MASRFELSVSKGLKFESNTLMSGYIGIKLTQTEKYWIRSSWTNKCLTQA